MKRKMLVVTMVIAMMMASLMAACGSNDVPANNTIIDTPTPTSEPTIAPDDEGVVDSGVLDDVPDGSEAENEESLNLGMYEKTGVRLNYSMLFPTDVNAEAWLEEHRFENPDYSFYITHFKNGKGDEMDFTWVAPAGIGNLYWLSEDERTFRIANDNRRLVMWNYGTMSDESELMKNIDDIETILGWSSSTPIKDTFQVEETNEFYRVTFMVNDTIEGKSYVGYNCYTDFYDIMECWQFKYLVEESLYTEAEALAVVNSIVRVNLEDFGIIVQE